MIVTANTEPWYNARRGRVTASSRASLIYNFKPKPIARLMQALKEEMLPSWRHVPQRWSGKAADRGNKIEPQAIADVEFTLAESCPQPGFVLHPDKPYCGATPDFFVGEDVSGQIKCPLVTERHLWTVYNKKVPHEYVCQVQWEAWVSGRPRILFVSFDPRQPMATRYAHVWLDADRNMWAQFDKNIEEFRRMFESGITPGDGRITGADVYGTLPQIF